MHSRFLILLSSFVASLATPAPGIDAHAVTIQRFPISNPEVGDLGDAMSHFKANHTDKIKDVFLGVIEGSPLLAEQIFVWHSPEDSKMDFATPFLPFSTTGALNVSATGLLQNETTINNSLHAPITETIVQDVAPGVDLKEFQAVSDALCVKIWGYSGATGCSIGYEYDGDRRVVLIGWQSKEAIANWLPSADNETLALFDQVKKSVVGTIMPIDKQIVQLP
ncbi:hypothetical protein V5O48_011953 [Marasmius crinis-equi]|uniref:ABM domain-containing protein n=1 Tax=Marasmius crinis-equi TaxID=585013 RepID=A0ABR3F4F7_9AGAR